MYKKMKHLEIPVSPEIAAFAVVMETLLQTQGFDLVESWEGIPPRDLLRQLKSKLAKLEAMNLEADNPRDIFEKAVSIGCFAMMLAEVEAKRSGEDRGSLSSIPASPLILPTVKKIASKA